MEVITAPERYEESYDNREIKVFLAGGITNCPNWQKEVINHIVGDADQSLLDRLVIFNPRRDDFPIDDPTAAVEQITWEYKYINRCDLFTMYFCEKEIQPICLYELGKWVGKYDDLRLIVTASEKYPRLTDIDVQTKAITSRPVVHRGTPIEHANNILANIEAMLVHEMAWRG